jgi:hypothetical protein
LAASQAPTWVGVVGMILEMLVWLAGCNILREFPEIFDLIADGLGETDACTITVAKGQL